MLASKRSFDGLRFRLNFADTGGAHGATRMWFSEELALICHKGTRSKGRLTRKGDFGHESSHVSDRQYTFGCIIDKKRGTLCPHIRGIRAPHL